MRYALYGVWLLVAVVAQADQLLLKNGDRLTGRVISAEDGKLVFATDYAGRLSIDWTEILRVDAETPMVVLLKDETRLHKQVLDLQTSPDLLARIDVLNPESWRVGEGYKFTGLVNLAFEIQTGNTNTDELDFDTKLELRRYQDRFKLAAELEYDRAQGIVTKEKGWIRGSYDYFPNEANRFGLKAKSWYYGVNTTIEKDEFASLRLRTLLGPHIGYQFYESKLMNLLLESGVTRVSEDYTDDSVDTRYAALSWSLDFDRFVWKEIVQFYHRQNGVSAISGGDKLVHKSWTGFRFPLFSGLLASTEIKLEFDGEPADKKDRMDTTYNIKLGYTW